MKIETQSKNVQTLTDANRAILESTQSLLQRQTEMVRQVLEEASEAVKALGGVANLLRNYGVISTCRDFAMLVFNLDRDPDTRSIMAPTTGADIILSSEAKTLTGLMLERVRRSPNGVAYIHYDAASGGWIQSSWRQTAETAGLWQAALRREKLNPGDRVALQLGNRPEWVYFDMASLGLGLVTVPLYTIDRPDNIRHILEDAGVRLLLLESSNQVETLAPVLTGLDHKVRVLVLEPAGEGSTDGVEYTSMEQWLTGARGELVDLVEKSADLATLVYTSGTTGAPKGVMLSHHNILWNTEAVLRRIQAFPQDRFLSFLPLSHTLERTGGYYLPMMTGSSVAYARSVAQLAEDLQIVRPTVLIAVPRIFERVYAKIRTKLSGEPVLSRKLFNAAVSVGWHAFEYSQTRRSWSADLLFAPLLDRLVGRKIRERLGGRLRVAVSGGASIPPQIARFFISLGVPLVQGYGLTEASPVVSLSPLEENLPHSVGPPLPGIEIRIGARNELLVKSPSVMLGYWQQPQSTAATVDDEGWLHTGDQVRMEGNHIVITGRLKDLIVLSNGEKVAPTDLEMAITLDSLFSQVLIAGEGHPYLTALAVLDPEAYALLAAREGLDSSPIAERLNPQLERILIERVGGALRTFPGHAKIPRLAVVEGPWTVDDGLLTPTLKPKRKLILEKYHRDLDRLYEGHR
ncbi:MAG: AMP-binding protein [Chromatiaceae bacterium]|nr:AMP-binding protein [Chromatiaceae bacterium]